MGNVPAWPANLCTNVAIAGMEVRHRTSAADACCMACCIVMPLPNDVANSMAVSNSVMLFWMLLVEFKDDWRSDGRSGMASSTLLLIVTHVHPSEMALQMASDFGWVVVSPAGPERPASMQRRYATVWLPPMVR